MPTQQPENDNHSLAMLALLASPFLLTEPGRQVARKAFGHVKDAFIPARTAIVNSTKAIAPAEEAVGGIAKMMEEAVPKPQPASFFDIMKGDLHGGDAPALPSGEIVQRFVPNALGYKDRLSRALVDELKAKKLRISTRMSREEQDAFTAAWHEAFNKAGSSGLSIPEEDKILSEVTKDVFDLVYEPKRTNNPMADLLGIKPPTPPEPKVTKKPARKAKQVEQQPKAKTKKDVQQYLSKLDKLLPDADK